MHIAMRLRMQYKSLWEPSMGISHSYQIANKVTVTQISIEATTR
jgi:hypothetical protein